MDRVWRLLQIKKIIAILLTLVFCVLALKRVVLPEQFLAVFTTVIGFYYGQSSARQTARETVDKISIE